MCSSKSRLCLTLDELQEIELAYAAVERRCGVLWSWSASIGAFAPQVSTDESSCCKGPGGPKSFVMTVNAGAIPAEHWTQDRAVGGGRIIGEACHFIDLLRFLAGAPIVAWQRSADGCRDAAIPSPCS